MNATVAHTLNVGPVNRPSLTKNDIHVTKSILALVCGSVLCWIPSSTVTQISEYINLPRWVEMITIYAASSNSAINPLIFYTFNKPFRRRVCQVFCPNASTSEQSQGKEEEISYEWEKMRQIRIKIVL
jgi:melatonin receptor type 1B